MVADPGNNHSIEEDLEELSVWESVWLLMFNTEKCKVLHVGKSNPKNKYMFLGSELKMRF